MRSMVPGKSYDIEIEREADANRFLEAMRARFAALKIPT